MPFDLKTIKYPSSLSIVRCLVALFVLYAWTPEGWAADPAVAISSEVNQPQWTPPCSLVPLPLHKGPLARRLATNRNAECIAWAGLPIEIGCAVSDMGILRPFSEPDGYATSATLDLKALGIEQEVSASSLSGNDVLQASGDDFPTSKTGDVICFLRFSTTDSNSRRCAKLKPIEFEGTEGLRLSPDRLVQLADARCMMEREGVPLRITCHDCPSIEGGRNLAGIRSWELESFFLRAGTQAKMLKARPPTGWHGRFCTTTDDRCARRNNQCRITAVAPPAEERVDACEFAPMSFSKGDGSLTEEELLSLTRNAECLKATKGQEARIVCTSSSTGSEGSSFQRGNQFGAEVIKRLESNGVRQELYVYSCGGADNMVGGDAREAIGCKSQIPGLSGQCVIKLSEE